MAGAHADRPDQHRSHGRSGFLSGELHKRENSHILSLLRIAVLRGLRPTSLILGKQPYGKWSDDDRLLLIAYQIYSDEVSTKTALPLWIARSTDPSIGFRIETQMDQADAALEKWDEKNAGKKKYKGMSRTVVAVNVSTGEPLDIDGLHRDQFFDDMKTEAKIGSGIPELEGLELDARPEGGYDPSEYGDAE